MNSKINVGIFGLGRISAKHIESLILLKDYYELKLVCDVDDIKLNTESNAKLMKYNSIDLIPSEILEKIDLFIISTPSGLHGKIARYLIKFNKIILIEKPFLLSYSDIEYFKTLESNQANNIILVMQNRFNDAIVETKRILESNVLGRLLMISAKLYWCRSQDYYDSSGWRGTYALDGGVVSNQASHYLDLIEYFGGNIIKVSAISDTLNVNIECEDTCLAHGVCKSGSIFNFEATTAIRPKNIEGSIALIFEKGYIKIGGTSANIIEKVEGIERKSVHFKNEETENVYGNGHKRLYKALLLYVMQKVKSNELVFLSEAIQSVISMHMLYSSIETGKVQYRDDFRYSRRLGEK